MPSHKVEFTSKGDGLKDVIEPIRELVKQTLPYRMKSEGMLSKLTIEWGKEYGPDGYPLNASVEYETV